MSLNWDCSKCPAGSTPDNEAEAGERECLIWGSIAVDMGGITSENAAEWLFRFRFLEKIGRAITTRPMTAQAINRWIGLNVNVVTINRAKWLSKITKHLADEVKREVDQEKAAA